MNRMTARWMTGFAAALIAITSASCSTKLLGISASIVVTPDALAFGQGAVGVPQQIKVSVSNAGSAPLIVTKIWVDSDPNMELAVGNQLITDCNDMPRSGSTTLSPGECARFVVTWTPLAAHAAAGDVEVDSSDLQTPAVNLPVTGNAASPALQYCILDSTGAVDPTQCSDLGVNPQVLPTVDFGTSLPSVATTRTVRFINQGQVPLTFLPSPVIDASQPNASDFVVSGSIPGNSLAPSATADLTITATPTTNGSTSGFLDVTSNDLRAATPLPIPLQVSVDGWQLCVNPSAGLDFGSVTIGQSQTLSITFTNCGSTALTIDEFALNQFRPTTNQFSISSGTLPPANTAFPIGAAITLGVTYTPTAVQADTGEFDLQLAVGGNALSASAPVKGNGVAAACGTSGAASPVANIVTSYSASSNGAYTTFNPTTTPSPVVPLDYVKLNGSTSTVASGTPTYLWQIVSQPAGSTATLTGTTTVQAQIETLVSGDYTISLTVKDASACVGTSTVTIHVASKGAVHIELTWNTSCGDLDLHYSNYAPSSTGSCTSASPGGGYDDCAYYNGAVASGEPPTSWGATLDHDDLDGYGPENITHATPTDGSYQVWVYYYSPDSSGDGTCATVIPTVNVYFNGVLSQTYTLTNGFQVGDTWNAADVTVSNSATQFAATAGATSPISGGGDPCTSN